MTKDFQHVTVDISLKHVWDLPALVDRHRPTPNHAVTPARVAVR
jgi:hypothetical protein